jgi:hypothetical protein
MDVCDGTSACGTTLNAGAPLWVAAQPVEADPFGQPMPEFEFRQRSPW